MGLADQLTLARVAAVPLVVALVLTWLSGLDDARVAPGLLRGRAIAP
ncbi:MAG TPA: hypothetical protein VIW19_09215 [Gaiellaceae bacterium]|jgi:hypothetical protein